MEALRWELTRVARAVERGTRIVVTYRGRPRFALVPLQDLEFKAAKAAPKKGRK